MTSHRGSAPPARGDLANTETRMRQALGLQDASPSPGQRRFEPPRQRHRFVKDGEVPVVVLSGRGDPAGSPASRIAATEAALAAEQAARVGAERALQEARSLIQALRTTLAHAELAHGEALAAERAAREQAQTDLQAAIRAREAAEQQLRERMSALPETPRERAIANRATARPRPQGSSAPKGQDPQPVKWWLPAARRDGRRRRKGS